MVYILLVIGLSLVFLGLYMIQEEKKTRSRTFKDFVVAEERDNSDYINLLASNQDLIRKVNNLDKRLGQLQEGCEDIREILGLLSEESPTVENGEKETDIVYGDLEKRVEKMLRANMTVDEIATALNIGKGEVLLLKNLLVK